MPSQNPVILRSARRKPAARLEGRTGIDAALSNPTMALRFALLSSPDPTGSAKTMPTEITDEAFEFLLARAGLAFTPAQRPS